jgi:hypothetical protein
VKGPLCKNPGGLIVLVIIIVILIGFYTGIFCMQYKDNKPLPASTPDKPGSTTLSKGEEFKVPPLFADLPTG